MAAKEYPIMLTGAERGTVANALARDIAILRATADMASKGGDRNTVAMCLVEVDILNDVRSKLGWGAA